MRRVLRWTSAAASLAILTSILAVGSAQATPTSTVDIRVMSFNILYGGDEVSLGGDHGHWCQDPAGCAATRQD